MGHSRYDRQTSTTFTMQIQEVFKGPLSAGEALTLTWQHDRPSGGSVPSDTEIAYSFRGIFFLKKQPSGEWVPLKARSGLPQFFVLLFYPTSSWPIPEGLVPDNGSSPRDTLLAKVAAEDEAHSNLYLSNMIQDAVGRNDCPFIRRILTHVAANAAEMKERGRSLAALLERGDAQALTMLAESSIVWPPPAEASIEASLGQGFRNSDPAALTTLFGIASSQSAAPSLRSAAVLALRSIHTVNAVFYLAELLDSQDRESRIMAAIGIASFVNGCPMETPANAQTLEYAQTTSFGLQDGGNPGTFEFGRAFGRAGGPGNHLLEELVERAPVSFCRALKHGRQPAR